MATHMDAADGVEAMVTRRFQHWGADFVLLKEKTRALFLCFSSLLSLLGPARLDQARLTMVPQKEWHFWEDGLSVNPKLWVR